MWGSFLGHTCGGLVRVQKGHSHLLRIRNTRRESEVDAGGLSECSWGFILAPSGRQEGKEVASQGLKEEKKGIK